MQFQSLYVYLSSRRKDRLHCPYFLVRILQSSKPGNTSFMYVSVSGDGTMEVTLD
jgi:hypothetical protein